MGGRRDNFLNSFLKFLSRCHSLFNLCSCPNIPPLSLSLTVYASLSCPTHSHTHTQALFSCAVLLSPLHLTLRCCRHHFNSRSSVHFICPPPPLVLLLLPLPDNCNGYPYTDGDLTRPTPHTPVLGYDQEWKYTPGKPRGTLAVIQICVQVHKAYVFHVFTRFV